MLLKHQQHRKGNFSMRKTTYNEINNETLLLSADQLMSILNCGRASAVKIGTDAGARVTIGRRVLFNRKKVEEYLNAISL